MNLLGTLAKVAVGVMLARGAGRMMQGGGGGGGGGGRPAGGSAGGGLGDLIGGLAGGRGGGAGDLLGGLLGSLAGGLAGGRAQGSGGGLGDLLGSVLSGGGSSGGGGLGDLLDSLGGGQRGSGGFGQMFNRAMAGDVTQAPSEDVHRDAGVLLQAMINAAKSDGAVDPDEQRQILEHLSDVGPEERDFVRQELSRPADLDGFLRSIPQELGPQAYLMSLLAIKLDSNAEVRYLDRLAKAAGLSAEAVNDIHARVGVPPLYS